MPLPMNFSNPTDLEKLYSMNPFIMGQAQKGIEHQDALAQLFADQSLMEGQQDIRGKELANLFNEQNNPLKLEHQRQTNDQLSMTNEKQRALQKYQIDDELGKMAINASDRDLKALENEGQRLAYSQNPQERAQGQQMLGMHRDFLKMREQEKLKNSGQLAAIALQGRNAKELEQMRIDAGKYNRARFAASFSEAFMKAKTFQQQAVLAEQAADAAEANGDEEAANRYRQIAAKARQDDINRQAAGAATQRPGNADLDALGIQTAPAQVPAARPAPGIAPQQVPTPPAPTAAPRIRKYNPATGRLE